MSYYDSDCFWTNEELGRKKVEEDHRHHGLLNWLKQLLIYVVDLENSPLTEANNQRNIDHRNHQNSYRTRPNGQEKL